MFLSDFYKSFRNIQVETDTDTSIAQIDYLIGFY